MSLALLLDLDDTLLKNKSEEFLPLYLKRFSSEVAAHIDPDLFVRSLLTGTDAMVKNRQADKTLKETFDSVFYPLVGIEHGAFDLIADNFYQNVFPTLGSLTEPIPAAAQMLDQAFKRGYQIAISTNPLFPLRAVLHRLDWANLPGSKYHFDLVTAYETFHFSKPNPEYFAEVMGRLGWPESAVVVGDDLERDIKPAEQLGLPTYRVNSQESDTNDVSSPRAVVGSIDNLIAWIDSTPSNILQSDLESPEKYLIILRTTPAVLDGWSRMVPSAYWSRRPTSDEWSFSEILCHLRDVDMEVNLPRVNRVLQEHNPFIPGEDTDIWAEQRQYRFQDGGLALRQFTSARMQLI